MLDVVEILLREAHAGAFQGGRRRAGDLFVALTIRSEENVAGHTVLARDLAIAIDYLHDETLVVRIVVPFFLEFHLAFAKFLNDLLNRKRRRFMGDRSGLALGFRCGSRGGGGARLQRWSRLSGWRGGRCRQRSLLLGR